MGRCTLCPESAEDIERIGGYAGKTVVCTAHNEAHPAGDGAEFSDNQMVSKLRPVEQHVIFFKGCGIYGVVVICVIPHCDIGGGIRLETARPGWGYCS